MLDLIQKNINGEIVFIWLKDKKVISPDAGHKLLDDAYHWYYNSTHCKDKEYFDRSVNQRWREAGFDRRSGKDRRGRYSLNDRRIKPQGRRWTDQINKYK